MSLDRLVEFEPCKWGYVVAAPKAGEYVPVFWHQCGPQKMHAWAERKSPEDRKWWKQWDESGWHVWHELPAAKIYLAGLMRLRDPWDHYTNLVVLRAQCMNPIATGMQCTMSAPFDPIHESKVTVCEYRRIVEEVWPTKSQDAPTTQPSTEAVEQLAASKAVGGSGSFGHAKAGVIATHTTTAQRNTVPLQQVSAKGRR